MITKPVGRREKRKLNRGQKLGKKCMESEKEEKPKNETAQENHTQMKRGGKIPILEQKLKRKLLI